MHIGIAVNHRRFALAAQSTRALTGTRDRLLYPPVKGRSVSGSEGMDVGCRLSVQLIRTDGDRGYIDLARQEVQ